MTAEPRDSKPLLFRGGIVADGSGAPPRRADVLVDGARVRAVEVLDAANGAPTVDVTGMIVAPGFVDLHSHADLILLADRAMQERLLAGKICQGVTTVVVGNCGLGVAPTTAEAATALAPILGWMTPEGIEPAPRSIAGYLDRLEHEGIALNVATLAAHGAIRASAMGLAPGAPTPRELQAMCVSMAGALAEGAVGLSTGLIYPPGMYSSTEELVALARVVAGHGGLYTSHVRGSSETLVPAARELIEVGKRAGARVHHSHLEAVGARFWPTVHDVLDLEDEAREAGVRISHDVFPYTRAATMMSAIFPPWALEGGMPALLARLSEPGQRERLRIELERARPRWPPWEPGGWPHNLVGAVGWHGIRLASVGPAGPHELVGRTLAEIGAERQRDPFDVVCDLMISEGGEVGQLVDEISGKDGEPGVLRSILSHPAAAVISDAEDYGKGSPHPAHAGAFARALRLDREEPALPAGECVRRMTSHPASLARLDGRGFLCAGAPADLVIFDPSAIEDRASWDRPRERARGVHWVLINGAIVVEEGEYRGGLPGQVLRRGSGSPGT